MTATDPNVRPFHILVAGRRATRRVAACALLAASSLVPIACSSSSSSNSSGGGGGSTGAGGQARPGYSTCDFFDQYGATAQHVCLETPIPAGLTDVTPLSRLCAEENSQDGGSGFSTTVGCPDSIPGCVCHVVPAATNGNSESYQYYYGTVGSDQATPGQQVTPAEYFAANQQNCLMQSGNTYTCFGGAMPAEDAGTD